MQKIAKCLASNVTPKTDWAYSSRIFQSITHPQIYPLQCLLILVQSFNLASKNLSNYLERYIIDTELNRDLVS